MKLGSNYGAKIVLNLSLYLFHRRKVSAETESTKDAGTKLLPAIHPQGCGFYTCLYL